MPIYTKEEQFKLIQEDWRSLENIENQYEEVCLESVKQDGLTLEYVKEQTPKICLEAVKENGYALKYVKEQIEEICLEAVKRSGRALQYIKEQTPEICLEAVKGNGYALEYVKEQTEEMCLEAVKQNGYLIEYVKEQTFEICLEIVKQDGANIKKIKNKTPRLCFYAFLNDYDLLKLKYIQKGIDKFINSNQSLENNIFSLKRFTIKKENLFYIDKQSLIYLKDYLLKQNSNKYILNDSIDIKILKEIAISNNELIIVDTGNIENIHRKLANRIVKEEDLEKESF